METRLRSLEEVLRQAAPAELEKAPLADWQWSAAPGATWSWTDGTVAREAPAPDVSASSWPVQQSVAAHGGGLAHGGNDRTRGTNEESSFQVENSNKQHDQPHESRLSAPSSATTLTSPLSAGVGTHISPDEPLAHEVRMLLLANSKESKYLGPSSGVPFARLIFSAIPQSQGFPSNWATSEGEASTYKLSQARPLPQNWTSEIDLQHLVDAYFETYQPFYPFLDEDIVADHVERLYKPQYTGAHSLHMPQLSGVEASLSPLHSVQVLLIIALGARILEVRLSAELSSERYLATAMQRIGNLALHDSIEGLQIMLLLDLAGLFRGRTQCVVPDMQYYSQLSGSRLPASQHSLTSWTAA